LNHCDKIYVESLCKGRSLVIGTGCNCIQELVEKYNADAIITLYESWECDAHDEIVAEARRGRYQLYHLPVQDRTVNPLGHIIEAVRTLARLVVLGRAVIVSCYGGCGRTGTVITLFNIVYRCMGFEQALEHYYRQRGCGPETPEQEALLYEASRIAGNLCREPLVDKDGCRVYTRSYDPEFVLEKLEELSPI